MCVSVLGRHQKPLILRFFVSNSSTAGHWNLLGSERKTPRACGRLQAGPGALSAAASLTPSLTAGVPLLGYQHPQTQCSHSSECFHWERAGGESCPIHQLPHAPRLALHGVAGSPQWQGSGSSGCAAQGCRARWYCLSWRLVGSELPNFPSHLQSTVCPPSLLGGDEWSYYICTILSCPPAKLSGELNVAGEG